MPSGREKGTRLSEAHKQSISASMRKKREEKRAAGMHRITDMFRRQMEKDKAAPPEPHPEPMNQETGAAPTTDDIVDDNSKGDRELVEEEPRPIAPNLDIEENEVVNEDDDRNDGSADDTIMHKYLHGIQDRLQQEFSSKNGAINELWLKKLLDNNEWWIPKHRFKFVCSNLNLEFEEDEKQEAYFRDVYIWLPEERWGALACMPSCPKCRSSKHVRNNGFRNNHYGRRVVALDHDYYCLSRRYRCQACEQKAKDKIERLKKQTENAAEATGLDVEVQVTQRTQNEHQYTFMAWNRTTLELFPHGFGSEFPAFLTHRAGVDKIILDLMRPLCDKGLRPHGLAATILELHSKRYHRECVKHELELSKTGNLHNKPMLSEFGDKSKYNGLVPTSRYLMHVYTSFHNTIKEFLDIEVKKRGTRRLHVDASYKEAKHLCQYHGHNIFKGLVTITNEFGEIRMQFHVVTDDHAQFRPSLAAFAKTLQAFGQPDVELLFTDNVVGDRQFYLEIFPSLQESQKRLDAVANPLRDSTVNSTSEEKMHEEDENACTIEDEQIQIMSTAAKINMLVTALENTLQGRQPEDRVVGLDAEWNVEFDRRGLRKQEGKLALLILAYLDGGGKAQACLLRLHKLQLLPDRLLKFLLGTTTFVGSNIGGDISKIGRDFKLKNEMKKVKQVNLGQFARTRDVVPSGNVGLDVLVSICLKETMSKDPTIRISNKWQDSKLSEPQKKYAAIDGIKSLEVYLHLRNKPDLTKRLTREEATTGLPVDIVPVRYGTGVGIIATRCGSGRLIDCSQDEVGGKLPSGISLIQRGIPRTNKVVEVHTVTAPHYILPHLKNNNGQPVCLGDMGATPFCVILPLTMLKQHVDSPLIRPYPNLDEPIVAGRTPPAPVPPTLCRRNTSDHQTSATEGDLMEEAGDGIVIDQLDSDATDAGLNLSGDELDLLHKVAVDGEKASSGKVLLVCSHLDDAPSLDKIRDIFSVVLGDAFHVLHRIRIPIKHCAKKVFLVAFRDALLQFDPIQLDRVKKAKMEQDNIKDAKTLEEDMYFNAEFWKACVPRRILPPRLLYWRVRAVFVAFGNIVDPKSNKPLFNDTAWKKANSILKEILQGHFSDPPGFLFYTQKLNKRGEPMVNLYGFQLLLCNRGTNDVENFHKLLVTIFGTWHIGIEMSDCLLQERRHRHNHMCSEHRRLGFPQIGHYDTWLIDKLQLLVQANHGIILYPHWVNASDFKNTSETFGTIALHNAELAQKLSEKEEDIEWSKVKLTHDMKYLCDVMGTKLPFLPIHTTEERQRFSDLILQNITDPDEQALKWVEFVDGVDVFPKLPVHLRNYRETFQQNARARQAFRDAKGSLKTLELLNETLCPIQPANDDSSIQKVTNQSRNTNPYLWKWETVPQQPHPLQPAPPTAIEPRNMFVGGILIDKAPEIVRVMESKGYLGSKRGRDNPERTRSKRRCVVCMGEGKTDEEAMKCIGNNNRKKCSLYTAPA